MRWAALFSDHPGMDAVRAAHMAAHQAYLRDHKGSIVLAGARRLTADGAPVGGLWIFEAETRDEVEAIIALDPFQIHGLRASSEIYLWGIAPGFEDMVIAPR